MLDMDAIRNITTTFAQIATTRHGIGRSACFLMLQELYQRNRKPPALPHITGLYLSRGSVMKQYQYDDSGLLTDPEGYTPQNNPVRPDNPLIRPNSTELTPDTGNKSGCRIHRRSLATTARLSGLHLLAARRSAPDNPDKQNPASQPLNRTATADRSTVKGQRAIMGRIRVIYN